MPFSDISYRLKLSLRRMFGKQTRLALRHPKGRRIPQTVHRLDQENMEISALKIVKWINRSGFRAYLVGGCIRDLLMGKYPKDFDVVSSASPHHLRSLFKHSRIIGRRFRILHVPINRYQVIEISTFRSIPKHRKKRTGLSSFLFRKKANKHSFLLKRDNIYGTAPEDSARRDITINALFYDIRRQEIIDYCGGYEDLLAKRINVIGDPKVSFLEDPVRMLRVAKFSAILDFQIEPRVIRTILRLQEEIKKANKNRLLGEIHKVFATGKNFQIFRVLHGLSLLKHMIADIHKVAEPNIEHHQIEGRGLAFDQSSLGKRLAIIDKMLSERENLTGNICMALLLADFVKDFLENRLPKNQKAHEYLERRLHLPFESLKIPRRDQARIQQIFFSQSRFQKNSLATKKKNDIFRNRLYFYEAFTFFKVYAICNNREDWIQQTMQWEFGPRNVPPIDSRIVNLFQRHKPRKNKASEARSKTDSPSVMKQTLDRTTGKATANHTEQTPRSRSRTTEQTPRNRSRTTEQTPRSRSRTTEQTPRSRSRTTEQTPRSRSRTTEQTPRSRNHTGQTLDRTGKVATKRAERKFNNKNSTKRRHYNR